MQQPDQSKCYMDRVLYKPRYDTRDPDKACFIFLTKTKDSGEIIFRKLQDWRGVSIIADVPVNGEMWYSCSMYQGLEHLTEIHIRSVDDIPLNYDFSYD